MVLNYGIPMSRGYFLFPILLVSIFFNFPRVTEAGFLDALIGKKEVKEQKNSQTVPLLKSNLTVDQNAQGGGEVTIVGDSALLPDTGVLSTSADMIDDTPSDEISIYIVRKGDSISGIAKMFKVSPNTIIWANDIKRGVISEGQELVILPVSGVQYKVKNGDTIKKIASSLKLSSSETDEILKFNGIAMETKLIPGEIIIIPDVEGKFVNQSPSNQVPTSRLHGANGPDYGGYFIRPIYGGYRSQGLHGYNGVDLAASPGTPIVASAEGDVIISRQGGYNGGYGNYVVIQHPNGTQTLYAHMRSNAVGVGDHVQQGQLIGYVGQTGKATGPHLHFEIRGAKNPF